MSPVATSQALASEGAVAIVRQWRQGVPVEGPGLALRCHHHHWRGLFVQDSLAEMFGCYSEPVILCSQSAYFSFEVCHPEFCLGQLVAL